MLYKFLSESKAFKHTIEFLYWNSKLISRIATIAILTIFFFTFLFMGYTKLHVDDQTKYQLGYYQGLQDFSEGLSYSPNSGRLPKKVKFWDLSILSYREGYKKGYNKYRKTGIPRNVKGMTQKEVLDRLGEPMRKMKQNLGIYSSKVWVYPMTVIIFKEGKVTSS